MYERAKKRVLTFVYDVEAMEVLLLINTYAWAEYFSRETGMPNKPPLYASMEKFLPAADWYTSAMVLLVLQIIALIGRNYAIRSSVLILAIGAGVFAQYALTHIDIVTITTQQNAAIIVAAIYLLVRLGVRRATLRVINNVDREAHKEHEATR